MSASGSAAQRRRAFIERIERLEEERKTLADDIASVYDELKADGHDKAAVKIIVKIRRKEDGLAKWVGYSGTVDEYLADLGMLPKLEEARAGARVRENIEEFPPHDPETGELTDTHEQPEEPATQFQAKASEDNGATGTANVEVPSDSMTGEVSRVDAGRTASATSERMDVTAGETAPLSPSPASAPRPAIADDEAAQANPTSSATHSNPQPAASLGNADEAGAASSSTAPATLSEKKDCLKLKDGHCKISFETSALCSECNRAKAEKARAA